MTIEKRASLVVLACALFIGGLAIGCAVHQEHIEETPQPTFYSPIEKHIMFVPKGCRIGDIVAPEDGIFIGRSKIIDLQIIEVPQPERQKKGDKEWSI